MQQALEGYLTIGVVIAVGFVFAHLKVLTGTHRKTLLNLAFMITQPALLFVLVSKADLEHLFSRTLLVSVLVIIFTIVLYLAISLGVFRRSFFDSVVGVFCASYTNAGVIGLPIAGYLLGDMTWMAPIILIQVGLLQPAGIVLLDIRKLRKSSQKLPIGRYLSMPFRNPITASTLAGLACNLLAVPIPAPILAPVELLSGAAVPIMLIALGVSLRLDPMPGMGPHFKELATAVAIKEVAAPLAAFLIGLAFGLDRPLLLAVTVIAALPTAQVAYMISARFGTGEFLARDSLFITTMLSVPVVVTLGALLG
ncbi:MAG: AEC family transporter [Propionibacteriaceae bacterium]|nr:AEC family transporter [Propionibacteriaceae bacterium]